MVERNGFKLRKKLSECKQYAVNMDRVWGYRENLDYTVDSLEERKARTNRRVSIDSLIASDDQDALSIKDQETPVSFLSEIPGANGDNSVAGPDQEKVG